MFVSNLFRAFIVTAKNKSMKDSAKQLFITESPLSRRIKILEEKLGCSLFLRSRDGVNLTNAGKEIYNALLPYYDNIIKLENIYLSKYKHNKDVQGKTKFNISVEFGTIDFLSNLSYFNVGVIEKIQYNYFCEDITSHLLNTDMDIFISNNNLFFDDNLVTCYTHVGIDINVVKSKRIDRVSPEKIIISGLLFLHLNNIKNNWLEEIKKTHNLDEKIELNIVPDVVNYISNIENGDAIGIVCGTISKIISNKFDCINVIPFAINGCDIKVVVNMYFLSARKENITKYFIDLLIGDVT